MCMDESSKQHIKETRVPLAARPSDTEKYDYEYERDGVSNLFMVSAPLLGWRHIEVTDRHTCLDWAHLMHKIVDELFPRPPPASMSCSTTSTRTAPPPSTRRSRPQRPSTSSVG